MPQTPSSDTAWSVTSQREDFQVGPNGQPAQGVVVTFTTAGGHTGSVFVPNAEYTAGKVAALVSARASMMDQIGKLTGG